MRDSVNRTFTAARRISDNDDKYMKKSFSPLSCRDVLPATHTHTGYIKDYFIKLLRYTQRLSVEFVTVRCHRYNMNMNHA